ncbi:MAG: hypothetical protein E6Q97_24610 [Desulfurellales bacterium]|nr:MAG: hypothetical protein E6Q97_24610 [Desulfurellales bacterium]
MGTPARFPFGVTTASKQETLGFFGLPDPTKWHVFFDDFVRFAAAEWTITTTEAGASSATEALGDAAGGVLVVTNDAADNDADFFQKVGESFLMATGKKTIFKARFKVSDATQSDLVMGLQITDTTPLAAGGDGATDGIFFQKDDGDADLDFYVQKNTTTGQLIETAFATIADDTYLTLGFAYDGRKTVHLFKDDSLVASVDLTSTPTDYLPDTELTVSFGIQNGEAVAKILTIDYIFAAQER